MPVFCANVKDERIILRTQNYVDVGDSYVAASGESVPVKNLQAIVRDDECYCLFIIEKKPVIACKETRVFH
jgi:hypothetical protein